MPKAMLVVFTGIDGSGKTTLAKRVIHTLDNRAIQAVYVHGRTQLFMTKPLAFIGNRLFLDKGTRVYSRSRTTKRDLFSRHRLLRYVYENIILLDTTLQLWVKIHRKISKGRIVVCDRYFYDTIITDIAIDMNYSTNDVCGRIDAMSRVLHKPDIVFFLDVDEEVAASRKNDIQSIEYLRDRRCLYEDVATRMNMHRICGDMSQDDLLMKCIEEIMHEFNS